MFTSLIFRLVALGVLVAACTTAASAWAAARAALHAFDRLEDSAGATAAAEFRAHLDDQLDVLAFEVGDYAGWSELYDQCPRPDPAWARINLIPGNHPGRLTHSMALVHDGAVTGRYTSIGPRERGPVPTDPAADAALVALATLDWQTRGVTWFDGHPALYAWAPVLHADGSGPPRGRLLALAYLDTPARSRLDVHGWTWHIAPDAPDTNDPTRQQVAVPLTSAEGSLTVVLERSRQDAAGIQATAVSAIARIGLLVSVLAALASAVVVWRWLRPLRHLAEVCRRRSAGSEEPIPISAAADEVSVLAHALSRLVEAEHASRVRLAAELRLADTAGDLHRLLLARMAHDLAGPAHAVAVAARRLAEGGGLLPPEEAARLATDADLLLGRIQDAVGAVEAERPASGSAHPVLLDQYAGGVGDLVRPQADQRGVSLAIAAPATRAVIDASLLTPALVNLLANALRASPAGASVHLTATVTAAAIRWEVTDHGPGLDPSLAERLSAAAARGGVLPGEPGFGLGLPLVITHIARAGGHLAVVRNGPDGLVIRIDLPR